MTKKSMVVNVVLDETGSMQSCLSGTISGFNEYVDTLKKDKKVDYTMSLTKFNSNRVKLVYTDKPIEKVPKLSTENYNPDAMTPLYDAIGKTINEVTNKLGKSKKKVLFVILTDGQENYSKEFDRTKIFDLIEAKKKDGWAFAFLGADIDAYGESAKMGVAGMSSLSVRKGDMKGAFRRAGGMTSSFAQGKTGVDNLFDQS